MACTKAGNGRRRRTNYVICVESAQLAAAHSQNGAF